MTRGFDDSKIVVGLIYSPHGIKGEVKFSLLDNFPIELKTNQHFTLADQRTLVIEAVRGSDVSRIVKFKDINDRTFWEQESLPLEVYGEKKDLPPHPDGCYLFELLELKLVNEKMEKIGIVSGSYSNGAQNILVLELENREKVELPWVPVFFPKFNIKEGWLQVILPEYWEA